VKCGVYSAEWKVQSEECKVCKVHSVQCTSAGPFAPLYT
jgi:hypothetical protein